MIAPERGSVWTTDLGRDMLVLSSTVYNELASESTVLAAPVFDQEPETGFGVDVGVGWAVPSLVSPVRKNLLRQRQGTVTVQALTNVNAMLFKLLGTPG